MKLLKSVLLTAVMLLTVSSLGAIPKLINFQGVLTDGGGSPLVSDTVSVEFKIYDSSAGATSKWSETQNVITDTEGGFNVTLGVNTPIEDTVFKDTTRYLGVRVESDAELSPRTKLVSVAYANRVSTVDGAKGGTIFGNTSVQSDLTVNGVIDATGQSSKIRFHYNDIADFPSASTYHGMFAHAHNQGAAYYAHAAQWVRLADSLHFHNSLAASDLSPNPALYVDTAGKVGIGIGATSPSGKLDVLNSVSSAFTEQGVNGVVSNSSTGSAFGGVFTASSAGTGTHTGVRGNASGSSFNPAYGVYGGADNSSSGEAYGGFFNVSTGGTGTGPHYAVWGSSFGISGPVYGGYFFTDTTGTGTKYGVYATAPTAEGDAGYFAGNATVTDTLFASNVSSLSPLRLQTSGTTRMYIDDESGFVGIGTSSPLSDLHLESSNSISTDMRIYNTSVSGDPTVSFLTNGVFRYTLGVDNDDSDKLQISGGSTLNSSELLTLTTTGNVGVGTSSPGYKLEVDGPVIMKKTTVPTSDGVHAGIYAIGDTLPELWAIDGANNTTLLSPHDKETGEWIFYSKNLNSGRVVRVDMERMIRKIEELTGEKFMVEEWEK